MKVKRLLMAFTATLMLLLPWGAAQGSISAKPDSSMTARMEGLGLGQAAGDLDEAVPRVNAQSWRGVVAVT